MQSHQIAVFHNLVEKSLGKVKQILDNTKSPVLASSVSHRYIDKITLAEFLTNCTLSSLYVCLTKLGFTLEQFNLLRQWSRNSEVTLRFRSEETCTFKRKENRNIDSSVNSVESSLFGKMTSKVSLLVCHMML